MNKCSIGEIRVPNDGRRLSPRSLSNISGIICQCLPPICQLSILTLVYKNKRKVLGADCCLNVLSFASSSLSYILHNLQLSTTDLFWHTIIASTLFGAHAPFIRFHKAFALYSRISLYCLRTYRLVVSTIDLFV